jgi:paraquat-inducible protein B
MSAPTPKISRAPKFPLVWIVPLVAVAVGAWMILRDVKDRGPEITIEFADGSGLEPGKSTLEYKGVAVGIVKDVDLKKDLSGVIVKLRLNKEAKDVAKAETQFWVVRPEIGLSGVRGLNTLLTGAHLGMKPGGGSDTNHFIGLEKIPPPEIVGAGRSFILQTDKLGSLTAGAPVFYRELKVGQVESSRLADDATAVLVRIHIDAPYVDLVRTSTHFWNAGGFDFKVSLLGAQLKDTSLESLLTGGVAFATPDAEPLAPAAPDGGIFKLATEADKEWLKWAPKIPVKSPESALQAPVAPRNLPAVLQK